MNALSTSQIFEARRDFNGGFARFDAWLSAQTSPAPEEVWARFGADVLASFLIQSAAIWNCGVHPCQRARLATLFCAAAHAKMQLDGAVGDYEFDPHEGQLWDAALRISRRAVQNWEAQTWQERGEFGGIFSGARHRLADLYRRAARCDERALRLYIEVFTGPNRAPVSRVGAGAEISIDALLERGAAISLQHATDEISARYGLCLLLRARSHGAPWLHRSLQLAREHLPRNAASLDQRLSANAARDFRKSQAPAIAQLATVLANIAQTQIRARVLANIAQTQIQAQAQIDAQKRAEEAEIMGELRRIARAKVAELERAAPQKNKRKARSNDTPIPLPISPEQLEFDKLFDEAFTPQPPQKAKKPPRKSAPVDDWDEFLAEFERDLSGE